MKTDSILPTVLVSLGLATACGGDTSEGESEGGETGYYCGDDDGGPTQCGDCQESGEIPYLCICHEDNNCYNTNLCAGSQSAAVDECEEESECGPEEYLLVTPVPGSDCEGSSSCGEWDPASEVTWMLKGGYYAVDYDFIADLIADPAPLYDCDDAIFDVNAANDFEVANADSGELLYELGLRDGCEPVSLNGLPLASQVDVGIAFVYLWLSQGETDYTLDVDCSCKFCPDEIDYKIVGAP